MTKNHFETRAIFKQAFNLLLGAKMYEQLICIWVKHLLDFMARKLYGHFYISFISLSTMF